MAQSMITFDQLMLPLMKALVNLGGSGSIDEIYEEVVKLENFDEETLAVLHNPEKSSQTEVGYRLAWARTYLKKAGYLENSSRGVWALTDKAKQMPEIDSREIVNFVRLMDKKKSQENADLSDPASSVDESPEEALAWREKLHHVLIEEMCPDAFERLTQRLLRESGFVHVEVTGRTGDGGIDGKGIACRVRNLKLMRNRSLIF
jgi:restriction system protein